MLRIGAIECPALSRTFISFPLKLRECHEGVIGKKGKKSCETLFSDGHEIATEIMKFQQLWLSTLGMQEADLPIVSCG